MQRWVNFNWIKTDMPDKISFLEESEYVAKPKTFWKIETAHAIFWMYLGGTA